MEISLDELLASREARRDFQNELLRRYSGKTLVCLTVVMPGSVKRNTQSLIVAQAALSALIARFGSDMTAMQVRDLATGYEAYLLTSLSPLEAKRAVCHIEETHPLGRLFDLDVMTRAGEPVSRADIGLAPRRCLLCDQEARWCMRNHTHTREELMARIGEMIDAYVG